MALSLQEAAKLENLDNYYARFCVLRTKLGIRGAWQQVENEYMSVYPEHKYGPERYESFLKFYKRRDAKAKLSRITLLQRRALLKASPETYRHLKHDTIK